MLLPDLPVLPLERQRRPEPLGRRLDHRQRLGRLPPDDGRHPRLQDAGLLAGDLGEGLAKILLVVDRDRGDDRQARAIQNIGRIEPAAEPDLE